MSIEARVAPAVLRTWASTQSHTQDAPVQSVSALPVKYQNESFGWDGGTVMVWLTQLSPAGNEPDTAPRSAELVPECGCTVLIDGVATRSCLTPATSCTGKTIVTIEGLSPDLSHPVQAAWIAEQVAQCGYCQSGQILSAAALLATNPSPTDQDIDGAMAGNICRCGTYQRIRVAIKDAAKALG